MNIQLTQSWLNFLQIEMQQPYFQEIINFLKHQKHEGKIIYPSEEKIFQAFNLTSFDEIKVVIIGQDPYHGENEANGLCFSVNEGIKIPPSLRNIFKEINADIGSLAQKSSDLSHWAKQGILLLNSSLTVEKGKPNSHSKIGWQIFTDEVIKLISNYKSGVVFLLWGKFATSKKDLINQSKHFILTSSHPSPLGAYKGFVGCKHFSKTNEILETNHQEKINW